MSKKIDTSLPSRFITVSKEEYESFSLETAYFCVARGDEEEQIFVKDYVLNEATDDYVLLLLPADSTKEDANELCSYFLKRGVNVLYPDLYGKKDDETDYTKYPASRNYADFCTSKENLYEVKTTMEETPWFEWWQTATYVLSYLKSLGKKVAVIGVRMGGETAWKTLVSGNAECGVLINSVGWNTYLETDKYGDTATQNMSDGKHAFIAGAEAQSYAPFVKCPVLMACSLRDETFDSDRAYDTFLRIGVKEGSAIIFSRASGTCIGPNGLTDIDLFIEKHLKGREIFIPSETNIAWVEKDDGLYVEAESDEGGIIEKVEIFYAETGEDTDSTYRDWERVFVGDASSITDGKFQAKITPFDGAEYAFAYATAKYINGFKATSKICTKKLEKKGQGVKSRLLFSGTEKGFSVADYEKEAIGGIFLEKEAVPKQIEGYHSIMGAYSLTGIKTYRIGAPRYVADKGVMLSFDVYAKADLTMCVSVKVVDGKEKETYFASVSVKKGGKWKEFILAPSEFKSETRILTDFTKAKELSFFATEGEYAVANILWL